MNWENDRNKDLKWQIFDDMRKYLKCDDAEKITIKKLSDCIDDMFDKLLEVLDG